MSVDLEDYYVGQPLDLWSKFESRVDKSTQTLLKLFEKYEIKATFFTVGRIAENHPELIKEISENGHEIASHSYSHKDIRTISKEEFESDLKKSIQVLEKITGEKILGFRAPYFSIDYKNLWAFDIIEKYLKYDSSVFPVKTPLYGIPKAPRSIYRISSQNPIKNNPNGKLVELPIATARFPIIGNIPIGGGFHFRFLPLRLIQYGLKKLNGAGQVGIFYIHPYDLDPDTPKIQGNSWRAYWGVSRAKNKFESIMKKFRFSNIRDIISENNF